MNVYLDIDGTILDKNTGEPASDLKNFLEYITTNYSVFWLTTHCKGDMEHLNAYLDRYINDPELLELTNKIQPSTWETLKTEAIDFSQPFIWLDDDILQYEQRQLEQKGLLNSWIKVDLTNNPNHLVEITKMLAI